MLCCSSGRSVSIFCKTKKGLDSAPLPNMRTQTAQSPALMKFASSSIKNGALSADVTPENSKEALPVSGIEPGTPEVKPVQVKHVHKNAFINRMWNFKVSEHALFSCYMCTHMFVFSVSSTWDLRG